LSAHSLSGKIWNQNQKRAKLSWYSLTKDIHYNRLKKAWFIALGIGALSFVGTAWHWGQFTRPELVPLVIIFSIASILFSAIFFFSCRIIAPGLGSYIIEDETKIKGSTVEMVTHVKESGDAQLDGWVKRYVFARNMFGLAIIPLLLLAGLFFFA
jgi:hypothetical protein